MSASISVATGSGNGTFSNVTGSRLAVRRELSPGCFERCQITPLYHRLAAWCGACSLALQSTLAELQRSAKTTIPFIVPMTQGHWSPAVPKGMGCQPLPPRAMANAAYAPSPTISAPGWLPNMGGFRDKVQSTLNNVSSGLDAINDVAAATQQREPQRSKPDVRPVTRPHP